MSEQRTATIRTYRHGLGDCFLLTFPTGGQRPAHVLVDCGVLLGTPNATQMMQRVVSDIDTRTDGFIDVVVATHEHWDHVSGFNQAREVFEQLRFGEIWLAWTEDLNDSLAKRLLDEREHRQNGLAAAFKLWHDSCAASGPTRSDVGRLDETRNILSFSGTSPALGIGGATEATVAGRSTTADALKYLRARPDRHAYLQPGQVRSVAESTDVRAFVLGPPRNETWLKKDRPSSRTPETYHLVAPTLSLADSFFRAVERHRATSDPTDPAASTEEMSYPFDRTYQRTEPATGPVDGVGFNSDPGVWFHSIYRKGPPWRQIDSDWLRSTADLALKLDNDTNNTSLVLAFELGHGGPVLLFPGDAQVGNWLSWREVSWRDAPGVSADDLLARTIFYKVGHHGSHNATLEEFGLERMNHVSLTAMVPVDRDTAAKQRWAMPFEPLWTRLAERSRGRVLRSDDDPPVGNPLLEPVGDQDPLPTVSVPSRPGDQDLFIDLEITYSLTDPG